MGWGRDRRVSVCVAWNCLLCHYRHYPLPAPSWREGSVMRATAGTPQHVGEKGPVIYLKAACHHSLTWAVLADAYFKATLKLKISFICYFNSCVNGCFGWTLCGAPRIRCRTWLVWLVSLGDRGKGHSPPGHGVSQQTPGLCRTGKGKGHCW